MKKKGYSLLNSFRYICLICLLVLGFITIVGTGDGIEFGGDGRITMTLTANPISSTEIALSWTPDPHLEPHWYYGIHKNGTHFTSVDSETTSITVSGLNPNTRYCFIVYSQPSLFLVSGRSNQACATTLPDYPPTTPANLVASAVSLIQIDLSWDASTDDYGVTGYKIYRDGTYLKSVTATSASDTGLNPVTNYCYIVAAYDAVGNESAQSNQACATTPPDITPPTPYKSPQTHRANDLMQE